MPFVAEFKTHGRSKMLNFGHAPDEDKDAIENLKSRPLRWRRRDDARYTSQWSRRTFKDLW
jgi:hypothetical protein